MSPEELGELNGAYYALLHNVLDEADARRKINLIVSVFANTLSHI
jgi:hypothetical protein